MKRTYSDATNEVKQSSENKETINLVDSEDIEEPPRKRLRVSVSDKPLEKDTATRCCGFPQRKAYLGFWLNRTAWTHGQPFNNFALSIDQILRGNIQRVVLYNYKVDVEWLFTLCPNLGNVPVEIAHGMTMENHYDSLPYVEIYPKLRLYRVDCGIPYGIHHTKMMIVYYPRGVRVVVMTLNLIEKDWAHKTQGIWMQDFPFKHEGNEQLSNDKNDFGQVLIAYLKRIPHPANKIDHSALEFVDFSGATALLVPSVPGTHSSSQYGHFRLRSLLRKHFAASDETRSAPAIAQFSSVGALPERWLEQEFLSTLLAEKSENEVTPFALARQSTTQRTTINSRELLKLLWPTGDTVANSVEGYEAGGSLCLNKKNCKECLKKYWHAWDGSPSGRMQLMPHIKSYGRLNPLTNEPMWFLLTSANMSRAAWGEIKQKSGRQEIFMRSFELGVLMLPEIFPFDHPNLQFLLADLPDMPLENENFELREEPRSNLENCMFVDRGSLMRTHRIALPIPYEIVRPRRYERDDKPWVWDVNWLNPDTHGKKYLSNA